MTRMTPFWLLCTACLSLCLGILTTDVRAQPDPNARRRSLGALDSILPPPQTVEEFWLAIDRDLTFGNWDIAKTRVEALLRHPDLKPETVLELREKFGSAMLFKLQNNPETSELGKQLAEIANEAARAKARDAARLRHFIEQLSQTPGERDFALRELRRSGAHAIPYFVEALQTKPAQRKALVFGLLSMPKTSWPAVAATVEASSPELVGVMLDTLKEFGVAESAEWLWHLAASPKSPKSLRGQAIETIASLLGIPASNLPAAAPTLAKIAEDYYQHRSPLSRMDGEQEVWSWENDQLVVHSMSVENAEEFLGIKRARQALDLVPTLKQARLTLVSLALQRGYERIGIDRDLPVRADGVLELVLSTGPDLMSEVLSKALDEHRTAVALGAVRSLGKTGSQSLLFGNDGPGVLTKALDYPSARVQSAATFATLNIHPRKPFPRSERIVDTLVRSLARDTRPTALIVDHDTPRGTSLAQTLKEMGYNSEVLGTGRDAFVRATTSGSIDLMLMEPTIRNWGPDETLANLRSDPRTAGLPVVLMSRVEIEDRLRMLSDRFTGVLVVPEAPSKELLETALQTGFADPMDSPLTSAEKAANQRRALDWTLRLARGEFEHLSVESARDSLIVLLASAESGPIAADALGYMPSAEVQHALAEVVLAEVQTIPLRLAASEALARNIQRGGVALKSDQREALENLLQSSKDDDFRLALAQVVGASGPAPQAIAQRLQTFQPLTDADAQGSPPAPKMEEEPAEAPEPKPEAPAAEEKPAKADSKPSFFDP